MAGTWEVTRSTRRDDVFAPEIIVEVCEPGQLFKARLYEDTVFWDHLNIP